MPQNWTPAQTRNLLKGLAFISPWLVGFAGFVLYPIAASAYYSLTRYDVLRPARFIGLENYVELFVKDDIFRTVLGNTVYLVVIGVPAGLVVAFLLASLLNREMKLRPLFRTIFFLPVLVPAVASAEVWRWVYNTNYGVINSVIKSWGLAVIPFISSVELAKPSLILIHVWAQGTAIIIFLAALQDVPSSLIDAAEVDGANALQRFWHVTIPICTPAILFVMLTGMIGMFQYFTTGLAAHPGRAQRIDRVLQPLSLPQRLPVLQDGIRLGPGLDPVHYHSCLHPAHLPQLGPLGLLRGRV